VRFRGYPTLVLDPGRVRVEMLLTEGLAAAQNVFHPESPARE
jgi:hypothetical protein